MAEKRMFSKSIVLSDQFLDMPASARDLYYAMSMSADDDGFVNSPKSIMRQCSAGETDYNLLLKNEYIIGFETGVAVIKHWKINNYLRVDRYKPTIYQDDFIKLTEESNGEYRLLTEEELKKKEIDELKELDADFPFGIPSIDKSRVV